MQIEMSLPLALARASTAVVRASSRKAGKLKLS